MTPDSDLPGEAPPAPIGKPSDPVAIGPESEVRGGSEAPTEALAGDPTTPPAAAPVPDGRPGERAALPAGSLPDPYLGPRGDENRAPPAGAPAAAETVEDARGKADRPRTS